MRERATLRLWIPAVIASLHAATLDRVFYCYTRMPVLDVLADKPSDEGDNEWERGEYHVTSGPETAPTYWLLVVLDGLNDSGTDLIEKLKRFSPQVSFRAQVFESVGIDDWDLVQIGPDEGVVSRSQGGEIIITYSDAGEANDSYLTEMHAYLRLRPILDGMAITPLGAQTPCP